MECCGLRRWRSAAPTRCVCGYLAKRQFDLVPGAAQRTGFHSVRRVTQIIKRGRADLDALTQARTRTPPGHPEGYIEAFSNLYSGFAAALHSREAQQALSLTGPRYRRCMMVLKAWRLSRRLSTAMSRGRCGSRQHTAEAMWMRTLHRLRIFLSGIHIEPGDDVDP